MRWTAHDLVDDERREGLVCVVLLLGGLDELLLALPAVRGLRAELPRHEMVLAAHPAVGEAAVAWGIADRAVPARPWHMARVPGLDVAVDLTGPGPESQRLLLQQRPRRLVAPANAVAGTTGPRWSLLQPPGGTAELVPLVEHRGGRWCRIVAATLHTDVDPRDGLLRLAVPGRRPDQQRILLHPGGPPRRRWPTDGFARLARALSGEAGHGYPVGVLALPGEEAVAAEVVTAAGLPRSALRPSEGPVALAAEVAAARLVIAGDTAVGHLAGACAVPGVHLYCATDPRERGPLAVARRHRVLQADPATARISVTAVTAAVEEVLDPSPVTVRAAGAPLRSRR